MSRSRRDFQAALLLTIVFWAAPSTAQQCDDCSRPRVALYDAQVLVPRPSTADSIMNWWTLQWPMEVARSAIHNTDPSRDCIKWYDGAMVNARDLQGDVLRFGIEYFNLPSAGEVKGADYLLTGTVSGSAGTYTLAMVLETAVSREVALTRSVTYGYDLASQESAAQTLVAAFTPLFQKIRNYEVNKRNTDITIAIRDMTQANAQDIVITPKKSRINIGDSMDVDIEMIDCDGVPLGNREIFFTDQEIDGNTFFGSTGGTVNPQSVTTDASGKAKVLFKAGSTTGLGQIAAIYPHTKPCGRHDAFLGNAVVVIGQPAKTLWQVSAAIHEKVDRRIDTTLTSGSGTGSHLLTDTYEGMAFINALVENGGVDTSSFYFVCYEESGDTFENATVCGNWYQDYFMRYYLEAGWGLPPAVDIQVKRYSGPVFLGSGYTGFEFHYPNKPTDVAIVAQCAGIAEGSSFSKFTSNNPEYHWEESSNDNPTQSHISTEFNANECSITKSGTRYTITGSRTTVTTSSEEKTTRTVDIFATISLFDSSTGVRQVDTHHSSSKNVLWNCPNSLSPNTRIEFALAEKSKVALDIIDIFGRKVISLANGERCAGVVHSETFDASKLSTGMYFCRLQTANSVLVKKLNVLK